MSARPMYSPRPPALRSQLGAVQVLRLPGDRATVVGPLDEVDAVLQRLAGAGRLMCADNPVPDGRPGLYAVHVRLVPVQTRAPQPARRRFWTRGRALAAVVAGLVAAACAAWLVATVVAWVAANLAMILAVLAVLAVLGGAGGSRVCTTVVTVVHRH